MKNIIRILFYSIIAVFIASCEGEDGLPGPTGSQGPQGIQGDPGQNAEQAYVFEFDQLSFTSTNNYELFLNFNDGFLQKIDNILVYFLWDYIEEDDLDVWRPLPLTQLTNSGTLLYSYDFTTQDVRLFLEGDFDLNTLDAIATDNWIARVVVVPGQFSTRKSSIIDYSNYYEVLEYYGLEHHSVGLGKKRFE